MHNPVRQQIGRFIQDSSKSASLLKLKSLRRENTKLHRVPKLAAGEYGVVLRPTSKAKHFSGSDVARAQGDGLMFDAIWTFQVPEDPQ